MILQGLRFLILMCIIAFWAFFILFLGFLFGLNNHRIRNFLNQMSARTALSILGVTIVFFR